MFEIMPFDRRSYRMSTYNPFREMQEMEKRFWGDSVSNSFRTDITETNDAYKLEADLPGFKKEDIKVDIDDDILVIKAEHSEDKDEKNDNGDYIRRERYYGSYTRSFNVSEINVDGITAAYENGVLTLTMPKKAPVKPESKHLEIM
ncbi:MAG: Hsp20/alpha crystallin family protein [Oscillospiraceae bacterium]|nr:Hsp20/alpha crystallin family protein [Oscillospiraceae bacterium]